MKIFILLGVLPLFFDTCILYFLLIVTEQVLIHKIQQANVMHDYWIATETAASVDKK
jgi:hypothetical protein